MSILTIVLSIVLGASLALLWGLIETLQILSFLPLLYLDLPGFMLVFYEYFAYINF
jgi:hypothetical protein